MSCISTVLTVCFEQRFGFRRSVFRFLSCCRCFGVTAQRRRLAEAGGADVDARLRPPRPPGRSALPPPAGRLCLPRRASSCHPGVTTRSPSRFPPPRGKQAPCGPRRAHGPAWPGGDDRIALSSRGDRASRPLCTEGAMLRALGGLGLGRRRRARRSPVARPQQRSGRLARGLQSVSAQAVSRCEAGSRVPAGNAHAGQRGTWASRAAS